jgi:hypothetical protein
MLESDSRTVARVLELADEYHLEIEDCLMTYFKRTKAEAREAVSDLLRRTREIEAPKGNQLHSLLLYHADPFDVAAMIEGVLQGTAQYNDVVRSYIEQRYSH